MKKYLLLVAGCVAVLSFSAIPEATAGPENKCKACHSFGTENGFGPGLKGVFGRKAGTAPGYNYSVSLRSADWVWDEDHLRSWINNSKKSITAFTGDPHAKTKMPKQRVKGDNATAVIAFLKNLK